MAEEDLADRTNLCYHVVGRLKPGVSLETASSEMRGIAAQLERAYPKENARTGVTVVPLSRRLSAQSRLLVTALFGAALAVLLIACTNLASLLLARGIARRRELAVRSALGAGRDRLLRQLLTESLLLAFAGGALGVALAAAAAPVLALLVPGRLPVTGSPSVDPRVLVFAAVLTTVTGILFGVLPALRACGDAHADALRDGERAGAGRRAERLRSVLVVAEVTASVALLGAAGLLTRALWKLQSVDPGFRTEGVLTLQTSLPLPGYDKTARRQAFYDRVLADVKRRCPACVEAGYISFLPMTMTGGIWPVETAGGPAEAARPESRACASSRPDSSTPWASRSAPVDGLAESDTLGSPRVAVVSESFVKQNFPGESPIGRRFHFAFEDREIVGVAGGHPRAGPRENERAAGLPALRQMPDGGLPWFAAEGPRRAGSAIAPASLLPAIRDIVAKADPQIPISDVRLLSDVVEADTAPRQIQARVLGAFAATALLLAGIGIHGLLAFTVVAALPRDRRAVALGAQPRDVLGMVLRRGARALAAIGVALRRPPRLRRRLRDAGPARRSQPRRPARLFRRERRRPPHDPRRMPRRRRSARCGWTRPRQCAPSSAGLCPGLRAAVRLVDALDRGRITLEHLRRPDGAMHQLAAAVGTDATHLPGAVDAERALERADPRVGRIRRKVPIAALAAGAQFEHFAPPSNHPEGPRRHELDLVVLHRPGNAESYGAASSSPDGP